MVLQSQRDCVLQPRVAESARLPWVSVSAIFNPNDNAIWQRQSCLSDFFSSSCFCSSISLMY